MNNRGDFSEKPLPILLFALLLSGCIGQSPGPQGADVSSDLSSASALISEESLFAYLEDLTAIQAHSGWRNSASTGEYEALDYVSGRLDGFTYLSGLGLEKERQDFHVHIGMESWESRLTVTVAGREKEIPADAMRGVRDDVGLALNFDSDGTLNDSGRDPVTVHGKSLVVLSQEQLESLAAGSMEGTIVFLDYDLVSPFAVGQAKASPNAERVLQSAPLGVVLVTEFSIEEGRSHGAFAGEGGVFMRLPFEKRIPILYSRVEDMGAAGIAAIDDLKKIESARLVWDADIFSPGRSQNLVARIPGKDASRAVILGAHIDSPANPGAMDDGSGTVALLEVARVLDEAKVQPQTDVYLVFFGSEELNIYGSPHFATTHSELLDRTLAMVEVDCLAHPLKGIEAHITLETQPHEGEAPLARFLAGRLASLGTDVVPILSPYPTEAYVFSGFDVPNINLIYSGDDFEVTGSWHYAAHVHDPYDTVELAREVGGVLVGMTRVALVAALEIGTTSQNLRTTPPKEGRVLFLSSHMESAHMTPAQFTDLGVALAREGFDLDVIPYGQDVTMMDLQDVDAVIVPPVIDYPSPEGDVALYDEAWSPEEIDALESYVRRGGILVLSNSAHRFRQSLMPCDTNEDWEDLNALAERFGVRFTHVLASSEAETHPHPLLEGYDYFIRTVEGNAVTFTLEGGEVIASSGDNPIIALVEVGEGGQVIVFADYGMLGTPYYETFNLRLVQNLASYIRSRMQATVS